MWMLVFLVPTEEKLITPSFTLTSHTDSSLLTSQVLRVTHYMALISLWWTFCKPAFGFYSREGFFGGIGNHNFLGFHFFFPTQQEYQDSLPHLCYSGSSKRRTMPSLSNLWPISKATDVIDMTKTIGLIFFKPSLLWSPLFKKISLLFA